jgi:hypothetical protein
LGSAPAVASRGLGQLEVYWSDSNSNRLKRIFFPYTQSTTGWSWVEDLAGSLAGAPAAVSWKGNRVDVFIQSGDLGIDHMYWNGEYWKP